MNRRTKTSVTLTPLQVNTYKKCSTDILEFIKYVRIFHPKRGWIVAVDNLFPKQRKVLKKLSKNWQDDFSLILSARQSGKTTIILILVLWIITFNEAKVIGILANKQTSAKNIFRRFSQMYHKLPETFRLAEEIGDSKVELELNDGTLVFCGPTSKSGLRSESLSLLVLDEFAWVADGVDEEFWISNYPTIEQSGSLIVTSTPNGMDNVFYDLHQKAKDPKDKKWALHEIWWYEVFDRGQRWKAKKIQDLSAKGKNGIEAFEREYNNSFEVGGEGIRFFNQESLGLFEVKPPYHEWTPSTDYPHYGIRVYEDVSAQHFLAGVDIAEGKGLNYSALTGIAAQKRNLGESLDVMSFELKQAFQYMRSDILPDDFFNLVFEFLITQLNDQWFLTFDNIDVGRVWVNRLEGIFEELQSGIHTLKNEIFKNILINKFESDKQAFLGYLTRRLYFSTGTRGVNTWGMRIDKKNNVDAKDNMKLYCDKRMVEICDEQLLHEMRLFEDKRTGGETMTHPGYEGVSHFDSITSLKLALWPLQNRDTMYDVMNITPLKSGNITRDQQNLLAVAAGNRQRGKIELLKELQEHPDVQAVWDKRDGVVLDGVMNVTSGWSRGKYKSLYFKK